MNTKAQETQVNTLVYTMGDEADDILTSLGLTDEQKKEYEMVKDKFEAHFVKRRNTIFERAKFNQRRQEEGESVDSFITSLYCLAEHCGYGALHNEMIRDRIVVGLQDAALSEKLQMDKDLTLDKAVASAQQREAVKKQQAVVRGEDGHPHVDTVRAKKQFQKGKAGGDRQWRPPGGDRRPPPQRPSPATMPTTCTRCGKSPHSRQQCPARDAICRKCSKKGHYQAVCRSKHSVGAVHAEQEGDVFIGTI